MPRPLQQGCSYRFVLKLQLWRASRLLAPSFTPVLTLTVYRVSRLSLSIRLRLFFSFCRYFAKLSDQDSNLD